MEDSLRKEIGVEGKNLRESRRELPAPEIGLGKRYEWCSPKRRSRQGMRSKTAVMRERQGVMPFVVHVIRCVLGA